MPRFDQRFIFSLNLPRKHRLWAILGNFNLD